MIIVLNALMFVLPTIFFLFLLERLFEKHNKDEFLLWCVGSLLFTNTIALVVSYYRGVIGLNFHSMTISYRLKYMAVGIVAALFGIICILCYRRFHVFFHRHKTIIKVLLFNFIGTILFIICQRILVPRWDYPQHNENYTVTFEEFENIKDDIQIFFVGSSHIYRGVSPIQLYADTGILSFNLSVGAQSALIDYYFVKEIFNRGYKPSLIAIDCSSLFIKTPSEKSIRYVSDSVKWDKIKLDMINNYINDVYENVEECKAKDDKFEQFISFIFPIYRYHDRWEELKMSDFCQVSYKSYFLQGYMPVTRIEANEEEFEYIEEIGRDILEKQDENSWYKEVLEKGDRTSELNDNANVENISVYSIEIPEESKNYLRQIRQLCLDNNCELLLLKVPVHIDATRYDASWNMQRHMAVEELSKEMGVPFVDIMYDSDIAIDWSHDSMDGGKHLNHSGAEIVTKYLAKYITENYKDIKTEPDNISYNKKLELYEQLSRVADIGLEYDLNQYVEMLKSKDNDLCILISAKNLEGKELNTYELELLQELGLNYDINSISKWDSYIAVIDNGEVKYEAVSNKKLSYNYTANDHEVRVVSAGLAQENVSQITIDGKDYSINIDGLNIVVLDKEAGLVIDRAAYEVSERGHYVLHEVDSNLINKYDIYLLGK